MSFFVTMFLIYETLYLPLYAKKKMYGTKYIPTCLDGRGTKLH